MNKLQIIAFLTISLFTTRISAQIAYSPYVDSLVNEATEHRLVLLNRQLSGDTSVTISGNPYTITSRNAFAEGNEMAAIWIYEQFEKYGYLPEYDIYSTTGTNVIAAKTGTDHPDQYFIICAHYDDMPFGNVAPGADDNASGVCAVLEAARIINGIDLPYTVKFIAFDEEEMGLVGSRAYADSVAAIDDDIPGVINLDMIAWDSDNDGEYSISTNTNSIPLKDDYIAAQTIYEPELQSNIISTSASDHSPFWAKGYQAILAIEDWNDFNDYYHTTEDLFEKLNIPYFVKLSHASIATLLSLALDYKIEIIHEPLASSNSTDDRTAIAVIKSSYEIATDENEPRLYYKVDGSDLNYVNAFYTNQDTFKFAIPGQNLGAFIEYYIAAQDENSGMIASLPLGGRGIDPPGEISPEEFFSYYVADVTSFSECSETLPKIIYDLENTYDTIPVNEEGYLLDMNVSIDILHARVSDLDIYLIGNSGDEIALSTSNGGNGDHYENTVFDDQANLSITEGQAPFDGSYKPEEPLSTFNMREISGNWILRVYDNSNASQGNFTDWCIDMQFTNDYTSVSEKEAHTARLYQNYPNPVKTTTTIKYELMENEHVSIALFDLYGKKVKTLIEGMKASGSHLLTFSVKDLNSGQYFYRLTTDSDTFVKKLIIIK